MVSGKLLFFCLNILALTQAHNIGEISFFETECPKHWTNYVQVKDQHNSSFVVLKKTNQEQSFNGAPVHHDMDHETIVHLQSRVNILTILMITFLIILMTQWYKTYKKQQKPHQQPYSQLINMPDAYDSQIDFQEKS